MLLVLCYVTGVMLLLKTLLNGKKAPHIPPIFQKNKYVTDLKEKSEIVHSLLAEQCSLISKKSVLPPELTLLIENTSTSCDFCKTAILKTINNQDTKEIHGHDMISILMLKLCGESLWRPIVFKTWHRIGKFPLE